MNTDEGHSDREVTKRVTTMRAVMDSTEIVHKVRQRPEDIKLQHQKSEINTRIHIGIVRLQGSPEETRTLMKPGLPSVKETSKIT